VTAFEKRLARSSARYREARRVRLIRRFGSAGAAGAWAGPEAALGAARGISTLLREGRPDTAGARAEDPARRAVSLWLRLLAAHNLILREVRRGMGGAATLPQFDVLAQLDREPGGLTFSSLSQRLLVSAGNLTGIVARLERGGLVHRDGDPLDRRAFRVRLTARGRGLLAELMPRHAALVRALFAELPAREQDELRARLARLGDAVVLQAARARHSARRERRDNA
jgi:DNA-binding MarR family transcriptional regulator